MNIFLYLHIIAEYVTNFVNVVKRANCFKEKKKNTVVKTYKKLYEWVWKAFDHKYSPFI